MTPTLCPIIYPRAISPDCGMTCRVGSRTATATCLASSDIGRAEGAATRVRWASSCSGVDHPGPRRPRQTGPAPGRMSRAMRRNGRAPVSISRSAATLGALGVLMWSRAADGQARAQERLANARSLKCTFSRMATGTWKNGEPHRLSHPSSSSTTVNVPWNRSRGGASDRSKVRLMERRS